MTRREYDEHRETLDALKVLLARIEQAVAPEPAPLTLVKGGRDA